MTSFELNNGPVRPVSVDEDSEVKISLIVGQDVGSATPMAQDIIKKITDMTGGSRLLKRSDFSPIDFKKYLTNIMLLDINYDDLGKPADCIVRLMGGALVNYFGEYTGQSVCAHPSRSGERIIRATRLAVRERSMAIVHSEQPRKDLDFYKVISLLVPVTDEKGEITQIFSHIQPYMRSGNPYIGH